MKLISPSFLKKVNQQWERERVLYSLFKTKETISIVMEKMEISFDEACEWVSNVCYQTSVPEASAAEMELMKRVANELINESREKK